MWVGRVDLGWVDGKRVRPSVYARTEREVRAKLTDLRKRIDERGGGVPDKVPTVAEWVPYWLREIAPQKPKSQGFYRPLGVHIVEVLGTHRLDKLRPAHVRELVAAVRAKTRTRWVVNDHGERVRAQVPLSSTTAKHARDALATILNAAKREGHVTTNVAELVVAPKRSREKRTPLAAAAARQVLSSVADDRLGSRWMTGLLLGARQGECLGLEWSRVDLDRSALDLSWQLQRVPFRHGCDPANEGTWACGKSRAAGCPERKLRIPDDDDYEIQQLTGGMCLVRPKTVTSVRLVPIPAPLDASLRRRKQLYEAERSAYATDHGLVWCRADGSPISEHEDRAEWAAACRSAGVDQVVVHAGRNTASTLLLEAGVDVRVVEAILGHSSAAMSRAYQHVDLSLQRRALDAVVEVLELGT